MYNHYYDIGHAWLEVTIEELINLGIADKISKYSRVNYMNPSPLAYLEEDVDMQLFIEARDLTGKDTWLEIETIDHTDYPNGRSYVRNYPPFILSSEPQALCTK